MITSQTSTTTIDTISCTKNNNILIPKCQSDDTNITCASDNINKAHNVPCANNYDNITLSKNNHQESGIEPIPISSQQNMTTSTVNAPTKSTEAYKLLTTEVSSITELLDNALKMEQLLANPSTTDTIHLTCTIPGNETLLLVMISSMKQIVKHPPSPSFPTNKTIPQVSANTTTSIYKPRLYKKCLQPKWIMLEYQSIGDQDIIVYDV